LCRLSKKEICKLNSQTDIANALSGYYISLSGRK
jgi:hypothetical protein